MQGCILATIRPYVKIFWNFSSDTLVNIWCEFQLNRRGFRVATIGLFDVDLFTCQFEDQNIKFKSGKQVFRIQHLQIVLNQLFADH